MGLPQVHLVGGTRPEAVKLAPVVTAMRQQGLLTPVLVASGQHPDMVADTLAAFDLAADVTLTVPRRTGGQAELFTELTRRLDRLWSTRTPAAVMVQGDTTTALAGALAAFWRRIPVVHLEAGLRSGDLDGPFPEEGNRRLITQIARLHLAPTPGAALHLLAAAVPAGDILVIGNTVVDAALSMARHDTTRPNPRLRRPARRQPPLPRSSACARRLVLVTVHRRESWGEPLHRILTAVRRLVAQHSDIDVVWPAHPNPAVRDQIHTALAGVDRVTITDPLPYPDLTRLLAQAYLVLTDSGGIQEEAPTFGAPVLVLRDVTERTESLAAGCALLVGTDPDVIVTQATTVLSNPARHAAMSSATNPYGDGHAARRAAQATAALLGLAPAPEPISTALHLVTGPDGAPAVIAFA